MDSLSLKVYQDRSWLRVDVDAQRKRLKLERVELTALDGSLESGSPLKVELLNENTKNLAQLRWHDGLRLSQGRCQVCTSLDLDGLQLDVCLGLLANCFDSYLGRLESEPPLALASLKLFAIAAE